MSTDRPHARLLNERALAVLLADAALAAGMATEALRQHDADPAQRAFARCVLAIIDLREGSVDEASAQLQIASDLLGASAGDPRVADLIEFGHALRHRRDGRLDEAWSLLRPLHARAAGRPAVDAYLTASAQGIVASMRGDADGSLDLLYQALELARRSGEDTLLVNALNNLGATQSDLYNLEDALPILEECLAGALRLDSRRQTIYAAGNLVQCLCLMGRAEQALRVARQHLIGRIGPDDPPSLHRDEEIAQALLDNGMLDDAAAALSGEPLIDSMTNEMGTLRVWLRARILLARGNAAEALQACLAHQERMQRQGDEGAIAIDHVNLLRLAAQAAAQAGQDRLGFDLLGKAFARHDELLGRAARSRQLSLQIKHRLSQTERERDSAQQLASRLEALNTSLQLQLAENERLQRQLVAQALEDPLTGLHNRRHLFKAGAALLSLVRRRGEPLAVALIDLDHFKKVNDRHGHDAGDQVLRAFARLARSETRAEDIVCRYGGEEFVLLMPHVDAAHAAARLGRLLEHFAALRFDSPAGHTFSCTFSAGFAVAQADGDDLDRMLQLADTALYDAKDAGRSRVMPSLTRPARSAVT